MNYFKRIVAALLICAMALAICGCEGGKEAKASEEAAEACNRLDEAFPEASATPDEHRPDFGAADGMYTYNTDGGAVYVYRYANRDDAITHAGYFSADGTEYGEPGGECTVDYVDGVHFWQCDDCIVRFVGGGKTRVKLDAVFGSQFAGGETYNAEETAYQAELFALELEKAGVTVENTVVRPLVGEAISGMSWFWGGNTVFAYGFENAGEAERFASGESESRFGSTFALYTEESGEPMPRAGIIYQVGPVVYLSQGEEDIFDCVSKLGPVAEFDGGTEGGEIPEDAEEPEDSVAAGDSEGEELIKLVKDLGVFADYEYENPPKADFSGYEHTPEAVYDVTLTDGGCAYLMLYDSVETALDESENYGGDGSEYSFSGGSSIVDYALPIHYYLSGRGIIQLGTWDYGVAGEFEKHYGAQFAGNVEVSEGFEPAEAAEEPEQADEPSDNKTEELSFEVAEEDVYPGEDFPWDNPEDVGPVIANSTAELESYIESCAVEGADISEYDERFFKNHSLMAYLMYEPTVSDGHEVLSAILEDGTLSVDISNNDTGDAAEDWKVLLVKFDKKITAKDFKIKRLPDDGRLKPCGNASELTGPVQAANFSAEYIRTDGSGYPDYAVISSRAELVKYYNKIKDRVFRPSAFESAMEGYSDEWFGENTLVIVAREFGSGSTKVTVTGVSVSESAVDVSMTFNTPETFTDDMAGWQILVGVKGKLGADCEVRVNGEEVKRGGNGDAAY